MKIEAAHRLLMLASEADEAMARKYIRFYTGVDSDTLTYLHRFGKEDKISFIMKDKADFNKAAINLTKHFKKPNDKLSTYGNQMLVWNLDNDRSIMLSEFDLFGNRFVITLQDKRPLNFLERRNKALQQTEHTQPTGGPRNPSIGWRTPKRR